MSAHTLSKTASVPRLAHLPLPLFAAPMGFGGIGLAWREAARVLGAPKLIGEALFAMTVALWLIVTALHIIRALHSPASLLGDLKHPVRSGFTGAIAIGMMLIAGGVLPYSPSIAAVIWFGAIGLQVALGIWFLRALFHTPREAATFTPLLLMPLIGNVVAPIVGAKLGFVVISWMLFGMGIALWVSVQPLLFGRIFTGPPLPELLRPTVVIFLSPPAVSTVAVANLTGGVGPLALALFGYAAMLAIMFATMIPEFRRTPFAMSWWGWTFPTAAFTVAALTVARSYSFPGYQLVLWGILLGASLILAIVSMATLRAALNGNLLRPE